MNKTKHGGAEVYLSRLTHTLKKNNVDCEIINQAKLKFLPSWIRVILFNISVCSSKKKKFYFSLDRIVCPDIYRAGDGVHRVFLKIEKKSKINPLHFIYKFIEKRAFEKSKVVVANSNMIKKQIIKTYGLKPDQIKVIYNGVELKSNNHRESFAKLSKEFNLTKEHNILLFVGSGFDRKGATSFIDIVSKLRSKNLKAFVIGKDKRMYLYKKMVKKLNLEHTIIFTGARDDVDYFYSISDIFILPTKYEPFSNVVLEAMSFENVVFTTAQNGASEVIPSDYIMKDYLDTSIVNNIEKLLSDRAALQKVKLANLEIAKKYTIEKNSLETSELISNHL